MGQFLVIFGKKHQPKRQPLLPVMNAKIAVICYKYKQLSDGTFPLMLRITKDGKRTLKSLGISIKSEYWNFSRDLPNKKCPNREQILTLIESAKEAWQQVILEKMINNEEYTSQSLQSEKRQPKLEIKTVDDFYIHIINTLKSNGKLGNSDAYLSSYYSLKKFNKGKPLLYTFEHIDSLFLNEFERFLTSIGNKDTTLHFQFRTLRAAYRRAIEMEIIAEDKDPFKKFKLSKFNTETKKRALSKAEVMQLIDFSSSDCSEKCKFAQDIFAFSYFCGGISFADIAYLTEQNITNGRIEYKRQKTGGIVNLKVNDQAQRIIDRYADHSKKGVYLFPILHNNIHKDPIQQYYRIHKVCRDVNAELKALGKQLGLSIEVTTYVARHSFATVLKKSGVDVMLISEALGHKDLKTTAIYLGKFDNEQIDEAMKALL